MPRVNDRSDASVLLRDVIAVRGRITPIDLDWFVSELLTSYLSSR